MEKTRWSCNGYQVVAIIIFLSVVVIGEYFCGSKCENSRKFIFWIKFVLVLALVFILHFEIKQIFLDSNKFLMHCTLIAACQRVVEKY